MSSVKDPYSTPVPEIEASAQSSNFKSDFSPLAANQEYPKNGCSAGK